MRYLQSKSVFEHYLKVYEEFEPKASVKEDIKDIFIELTDNYLDVELDDFGTIIISKSNGSDTNLQIISSTYYDFDIDSYIIDSILRLIDYLKSNKLYLNNIIIQKLRLGSVSGLRRWVTDDLYVSNITEEGLFTSKFIDQTGRYESKLFSEPAHKIIIKYSNCL